MIKSVVVREEVKQIMLEYAAAGERPAGEAALLKTGQSEGNKG
jgi:hypothetical protein